MAYKNQWKLCLTEWMIEKNYYVQIAQKRRSFHIKGVIRRQQHCLEISPIVLTVLQTFCSFFLITRIKNTLSNWISEYYFKLSRRENFGYADYNRIRMRFFQSQILARAGHTLIYRPLFYIWVTGEKPYLILLH